MDASPVETAARSLLGNEVDSMNQSQQDQPLHAVDMNVGPISAADHDKRWHVLHTKSRQEKALAEFLAEQHIDFLLPLVKRVAYYGKRKARVETPLFPGYVFLHGTLEEAYTADRTHRVARIIAVFDQVVLHEQLQSLKIALAQPANFDPYPFLVKGTRVEVTSGPMRGIRGIVEDRTKMTRLVLQVDVLGQAVSMEIDAALLQPIADREVDREVDREAGREIDREADREVDRESAQENAREKIIKKTPGTRAA